ARCPWAGPRCATGARRGRDSEGWARAAAHRSCTDSSSPTNSRSTATCPSRLRRKSGRSASGDPSGARSGVADTSRARSSVLPCRPSSSLHRSMSFLPTAGSACPRKKARALNSSWKGAIERWREELGLLGASRRPPLVHRLQLSYELEVYGDVSESSAEEERQERERGSVRRTVGCGGHVPRPTVRLT